MRHPSTRTSLLAAVMLLAAPLPAQAPARVMGAPYQDASRAFIDLMIPHHEMALMMARHAITAARSEEVKDLARRMSAEQTREIADLRSARRTLFGSDSSRSGMTGAMMQMMQMMGGAHMGDSTARHAMRDSMQAGHHMPSGQQRAGRMMQMPMGMDSSMMGDMDRMFLEHMIAHHQDGIDMAILAEDSQAAARVKQLAMSIRQGQERDLAEMRRLLAALPAMGTSPHEH